MRRVPGWLRRVETAVTDGGWPNSVRSQRHRPTVGTAGTDSERQERKVERTVQHCSTGKQLSRADQSQMTHGSQSRWTNRCCDAFVSAPLAHRTLAAAAAIGANQVQHTQLRTTRRHGTNSRCAIGSTAAAPSTAPLPDRRRDGRTLSRLVPPLLLITRHRAAPWQMSPSIRHHQMAQRRLGRSRRRPAAVAAGPTV